MTVSRFLFPILTSKSRETSQLHQLPKGSLPCCDSQASKAEGYGSHEPWRFSMVFRFIPFHPFHPFFLNLLIFSHPWRQYRNLLETEIAAFQWSAHLTRLQHICIIFHPNMIAVWMQQKTRISTGAQIETSFIKTQIFQIALRFKRFGFVACHNAHQARDQMHPNATCLWMIQGHEMSLSGISFANQRGKPRKALKYSNIPGRKLPPVPVQLGR